VLGQPGVELLDPFRGCLPRHRLPEVRSEAIKSVAVLKGLEEMLLKFGDIEGDFTHLLIESKDSP